METGCLVEYIDRQKIVCAVVMEVKDKRLRVLSENNREVNLSANRLAHTSKERLDPAQGRERMVAALKRAANRREELSSRVDIGELWEVLNSEQEWIDLATMTELCFPDHPTSDHESAVVRAFFKDRLYFKFSPDQFFPHDQEQVDQLMARQAEAERKNRLIAEGAARLKSLLNGEAATAGPVPERDPELIEIFSSLYLHGRESRHYTVGEKILEGAGLNATEALFPVLVRLGVWEENENIDLITYDIPTEFPPEAVSEAEFLAQTAAQTAIEVSPAAVRRDLTQLPLMTIDGQSTLDYDDALSLETRADSYRLGVHIVDVGHHVKKNTALDREALARCSSIYMPDRRLPMLPAGLAEDLCSLKAGHPRPAISTLVTLSASLDIVAVEIVPSLVRVAQQLTYYDVNVLADENQTYGILRDVAARFHDFRLQAGAVQITLPEVHVWIGEGGEINVNRINRESPGRMLVSELMIMANWLMGRFLKELGLPAVFRSQPEAKERLYRGDSDSLFQNIMQRRLLNRFVLSHKSETHAGLGLDTYVTATSPIRKYCDLVTQRQMRAAFELEDPYTTADIDAIIRQLELPMSQVSRIQHRRVRYWILKYLEKRVGQKEEAIVLAKRRRGYQVLIPEYMLECDIPFTSGLDLKPEDLVQVVIQRANARRDILNVFVG
ncbi:MAG: RNB domain-containing ribonuclease [Deltaproteobacteria bacterium]|nr:RNB domain-containing ribonuclease [Deltaproteobacteria bacterium]